MNFTEQQINDWHAYERVRKGGRWNMFMPQARAATGLSRDDYLFVMRNFVELRDAAIDAAIDAAKVKS